MKRNEKLRGEGAGVDRHQYFFWGGINFPSEFNVYPGKRATG